MNTTTNTTKTTKLQKLIDNILLPPDYSKLIDEKLVPKRWWPRHFKVIHLIGPDGYCLLVQQAIQHGTPPAALLAHLVSEVIKHKDIFIQKPAV